MTGLTDLPKDVLWLILRHVVKMKWKESYESWNVPVTIKNGHFGPDYEMGHLMVSIAAVSKRMRTVLQSKCSWQRGSFKFRTGVFD